jgi:aspartate carbamoyltransferase
LRWHAKCRAWCRVGTFDLLKGKILANVFYEPSTRTSSSFTAAMERLGGSVIPINEVRYSSVSKGESLPDTVRTLERYADVIVLRHPDVGASALAAEYASKPIINAGDGIGEHPTQALLDLFTISEELGVIDPPVTMVGDLKYGRTVRRLLTLFDVRINLVAPKILQMPPEIMKELQTAHTAHGEYADLDKVVPSTDVLYITRVQKERFNNVEEYEAVKDSYVVTPQTLQTAKQRMIVMHPLPRINEISGEVDSDPRAAYFRQMEYGMYVRMALLAMVLGKA